MVQLRPLRDWPGNAQADQVGLEAEGYGKEHPVANNATEEGRQPNRRIDVRVTKK